MKKSSINYRRLKNLPTLLVTVNLRLLIIIIGSLGIVVLLVIFIPYRPRVVALDSRNDPIELSIAQYNINESPKFLIYTDTIVREAEKKRNSNKFIAQVGIIEAEVLGSNGSKTNLIPEIESVASDSSVFNVSIPNNQLLIPGKLTLRLLLSDRETTRELRKDFRWNTTLINFNQSSYTLGEAVQVSLGIFDISGKSVCDAVIILTVTSPNRERTFYNTNDKSVFSSNKCQTNVATNQPDFAAVYIPKSEGNYQVRLEAKNSRENWVRETSFLVTKNVDFTMRYLNTPLRIAPRLYYSIAMELRSDQLFGGELYYDIPVGLTIKNINADGKLIKGNNLTDTIVWPISTNAGDTKVFSFTFYSTNQGPEFYRTGPLRLINTQNPKSVESSQESKNFLNPSSWEIASESNDVYQKF